MRLEQTAPHLPKKTSDVFETSDVWEIVVASGPPTG